MPRMLDRSLAWLLVLAGVLLAYGSLKAHEAQTTELVWSLAGAFAAVLLAAINLLRISRPGDRPLAWVCFIGSLCWVAIAVDFGIAIDHLMDLRVIVHALTAFGLAAFSLAAILRRRAR